MISVDSKVVPSAELPSVELPALLRQMHQLREQYMRDLYCNESMKMSFEDFIDWWSGLTEEGRVNWEARFRKGWEQELSERSERLRLRFSQQAQS